MNNTRWFSPFALLATFLLATVSGAFSQNAPALERAQTPSASSAVGEDFQPPSEEEIKLLRTNLRSQKRQIIAANMKLTDKEAEKFWPLYDQYTAECSKIIDRKSALIHDYLQNYGDLSDLQAEQYLKGRTATEESLIRLREKYIPVFRTVLSAKATTLFFQLDYRMALMIDLQLTSQLPLVEPTDNTP